MTAAPKFRAWLQLVRFPAVFTAMSDIVLGFVLAHSSLSPAWEFVALLGASSGLYLAGMTFNDYFDRHIDARERPNRPIPSGRISPRAALTLGWFLTAAGLACAWSAGPRALAVAGMLTAAVLAYDGFFKTTAAGPLVMGSCRMLNVLLGASAAVPWQAPQISVAAAMGIYTAGITWFARREAVESSRRQLLAAAAVIHVGIAVWIALVFVGSSAAEGSRWGSLVVLAIVIAFVDWGMAPAFNKPSPGNVQTAVKRLLLAIVLFDAALAYWKTGEPLLSCATALLVVPAATLGRWIFIT